MKFNTDNAWPHAAIASALLAASLPTLAVTGDTSQPIHIDSAHQSLDMQGNTVTFTGNVTVKQGTIDVKADKVVVTRTQGSQGQEVIEAFGNPVTFYQMQDNGKPVKGRAQKVRHELAQDKITLTGNAYLEQLDSNVKGDRITYLVKQQQMEAVGDKGGRVTTVLVPSQLQEKNGKAAAPSSQKDKQQPQATE
ncbi:lipopolysaccharide ABC transporter substrate-binding protein LptA [Candidatus Symbiopectobacterium sp.]|uniref:lipopolysaccharide ABC transporter substrate-binding protein LptA n=1 Tax=Candidatus Symbiopectobacterium sp. TaxID=2816440 RepID=UPI0025BE358F|nr:lipopolysaccharide ABC transporter substrate-binding protein LptA [Candidatus Symbiopectobacterium sp.]